MYIEIVVAKTYIVIRTCFFQITITEPENSFPNDLTR